jgi:hypothetical protein
MSVHGMTTDRARVARPWRLSMLVMSALVLVAVPHSFAQLPGDPSRPPGLPSPTHVPLRVAPPILQITSPPHGATFHEERVRLVGAASSSSGVSEISITVNDRTFSPREFQSGSRYVPIEALVDLTPGENVINIVVKDGLGGRTFAQRRVLRSLAGGETPERWAVVIGVRKYDNPGIPARRFAEQDALSVFELLTTRAGFKRNNVRFLHEGPDAPTLTNVRRALGEWLVKHVTARDSVLIYFAGRGAKDDDRAYLLPRDADPAAPETTALDLEQLEALVRNVNARSMLIVVDASFRPVPGSFVAGTTEHQFMSALSRRAGRVVIAASSENEEALELATLRHGLFTHYFLKALEGDADANRDGVVTGAELRDHLERAVGDHAQNLGTKQRPVMHGAPGDVPVLVERK